MLTTLDGPAVVDVNARMTLIENRDFCGAMLCKRGLSCHAVSVCLCVCVCLSRSYILSKRIKIFS